MNQRLEQRLRRHALAGGHDGGGEGVESFGGDRAEDGGQGEFFTGILQCQFSKGDAGVG